MNEGLTDCRKDFGQGQAIAPHRTPESAGGRELKEDTPQESHSQEGKGPAIQAVGAGRAWTQVKRGPQGTWWAVGHLPRPLLCALPWNVSQFLHLVPLLSLASPESDVSKNYCPYLQMARWGQQSQAWPEQYGSHSALVGQLQNSL